MRRGGSSRAGAAGTPAPLLLAALSLGAACTGTRPGEVSGRPAVVALLGEVDSWNPYTTRDATSASVLELLYPRLVRETAVEGGTSSSFEPWLAQSWSFSPDRRTLEFRLRPDAYWSDGRPVRCEDVRFTLEAQRSDELAWPGASVKERIVAVDCPEPKLAVFRFAEAYADQMLDANDDAIVPEAYGEVPFSEWRATAWQRRAVTCGPFRIASWTAGQEAVLERDARWWGAEGVLLDRVILRLFPDATAASLRLLEGEVDVLPRLPPLRARQLEASGSSVLELPPLAYAYIAWNVLDPDAYEEDRRRRGCGGEGSCEESEADLDRLRRERPHFALSDRRVRLALSFAVDRQDLVEGLFGGYARPGSSPIVSALWAHDPAAAVSFDPARAAALLDEAGWRDTDGDGVRDKDGKRLELKVLVNAESMTRRDALGRIAASTARIGARLVPVPLQRADYVARARAKRFDALLGSWRAGTRLDLGTIFHSRAALDRGNNFTAWATPVSDELLDRAARAATREEALPVWRAWQAHFREQQPYTVLYEETLLVGLSPRVRAPAARGFNPFDGLHQWRLEPTVQRIRAR